MIYIILFLILTTADQISKYLVATYMTVGESIPVIGDFFRITYVQNLGVAFGFLQGKKWIIAVGTIVAIIFICYHLYNEKNKIKLVEKMGYTYILAGAVGNMIDRYLRGYVVDMLDFRGVWCFIFNLADVWINIGVILVILDQLISRKNVKK